MPLVPISGGNPWGLTGWAQQSWHQSHQCPPQCHLLAHCWSICKNRFTNGGRELKKLQHPHGPLKTIGCLHKKARMLSSICCRCRQSNQHDRHVQMGVRHAIATGVMHDAYWEWKRTPKPEQTWNHWKEHFNDAYNELKELNAITAELMGYGTSNITEQAVAPDVVMALDNLASTAIFKIDALDILVAANKQLANALAHVTKKWKIAQHGKSTDQWYNKNQTTQRGNSEQLLLDPWHCHECQPQ